MCRRTQFSKEEEGIGLLSESQKWSLCVSWSPQNHPDAESLTIDQELNFPSSAFVHPIPLESLGMGSLELHFNIANRKVWSLPPETHSPQSFAFLWVICWWLDDVHIGSQLSGYQDTGQSLWDDYQRLTWLPQLKSNKSYKLLKIFTAPRSYEQQ